MKISEGKTKNEGSKPIAKIKDKSAKDGANKLGLIGAEQTLNKENTAQVTPNSTANSSLTKLLNKPEGSVKIAFSKKLPANTNALKTKFTKNAFSHYVTKK